MSTQRTNIRPRPWCESLETLRSKLNVGAAGVVLVLLGLLGVVGSGCGGSSQGKGKGKPSSALKSVTAKMTVRNAPIAPSEGPTPPPSRQGPPPAGGSPARPERAAPAEPSTPDVRPPDVRPPDVRPPDVADWKRDDYFSAARGGDPQLVVALAYFGPHFAGKESAANFLANLLESLFAEPGAGAPAAPVGPFPLGRIPSAGGRNAKFTEAAIAALGVNGTPRARQILEAIVAGTFKKADKPARLAALNTLAADRGAQTDDLLLRLVTAPEQAELDDRATRDSESVRLAALQLISSRSSESLSLRLAKAVATTEVPKTVRDQILACLSEPRMENVAPQIMLYQSDRLDPGTRSWLEQRLLAYSSGTLGRLLGLAATEPRPARYVPAGGAGPAVLLGQQQRGASSIAVAPSNPYRAAELLWSSNLAAVLERRLADVESLAGGLPLITLAGTVPRPTVRAALLRALERHWGEGPRPLLALCGTDALSVEPGLVVLLKALPRNDAPEVLARSHGNHFGAGRTAKRPPGLDVHEAQKNADALEVKRRRERLGQEWLEFSRAVVQAICRRCYAAARAADTGGAVSSDDADLPFKLDPGARVTAVYRVNWPAALDGKLAGAPLLRVRYARIEEKAAPAKVLAYYCRQAPHAKEHPLPGGVWIDGGASHGEKGRASSVDVLVGRLRSEVGGLPNDKQELIVDILTVECDGIALENLHPVGH